MAVYDAQGNALTSGDNLGGLTWMQIGDSLTANESGSGAIDGNLGFGSVIARNTGCRFINSGVFGASWTVRNDAGLDAFCGVTKVNELLASGEIPDILTIALGTNDRENGVENDTRDNTSTLYGAVRHCLYELKTKAPTLRLGIVIPPNSGNTCGVINASQDARNDIIRQVCREFSVPYCDMMYESGITPDMLSDGLHLVNPNTIVEGMPLPRWLYMRRLEKFLLTL